MSENLITAENAEEEINCMKIKFTQWNILQADERHFCKKANQMWKSNNDVKAMDDVNNFIEKIMKSLWTSNKLHMKCVAVSKGFVNEPVKTDESFRHWSSFKTTPLMCSSCTQK